ncbi:MAG: cupredoxin domain-containing protein, partial [Bacteroidales bacterium]
VNAFINQGSATTTQTDPNVTMENGVQVVKMTQTASGYSPNSFTIKKGIPVKWIVTSEDAFSCAASIVSSKLGIRKNLEAGENIIEFTPTEIGSIRFTCSMGMYSGSFNVVDDNAPSSSGEQGSSNQPVNNPPVVNKGASCGGGGGGCGCGAKVQRQAAVDADKTPPVIANQGNSVQVIKAIYAVADDVKPNKFTVKPGIPVRFDIEAKEDGAGCMGSIMIPGLDNKAQGFEKGKITTLSFTPTKSGTYTITCAMGVPRGSIIVE